jgi:outer membrane protein OmpA-like peptidoglycan-associated protein
MLDGVELPQAQRIASEDEEVLAQHGVPALEGDFLQDLGRRAVRVTLTGVLTGPEAGEDLKGLRDKFHAVAPVPFVSDIGTATKVDKVLIEEMGVRELAGKTERFEYALSLREYIPPPAVTVEVPPVIPIPPVPTTATLVVTVIVEGEPGFDFSRVRVTAGSRTLTNRANNVWTEPDFPPGSYRVEAVVDPPDAMSGSAQAEVREGETTEVTITLRRGEDFAKAFLVHFWFDNAFVEPCMLEVLADVAEYAGSHPEERLLIVGHCDKTGSDAYNQSLSERRARSVFAALIFGRDRAGAVAEWNTLRRAHLGGLPEVRDGWGTREYQYMLQDLDYYPGNIDGNRGPQTDAGVRAFQRDHGLTEDGVVGDATWTALIEAYLGQASLAIPESQLFPNCPGEVLKWLGCGEQDPVKNTEDAWRPNRRAELIFKRAEALPCKVPQPDTFNLPAPGAVNNGWCLGPGDPNHRCCFLARTAPAEDGRWLVQPAEPGTVTVKGSIVHEDGTPLANTEYVLIAPDGENMDGERPSGPTRGRPIPGRTRADGTFSYPDKPKGIGHYILEVRGPFVARLAEDPPGSGKGPIVCKKMDGSSDLDVVVSPAETGDPRRRVRGIVHDPFGRPRPSVDVTVLFDDDTSATTQTNDRGEFVVETAEPRDSARIRYSLSDEDPSEVVELERFFIDPKAIDTDEGLRRRLHNLGFLAALAGDLADALLTFQGAQGLDTTGEADEGTRARLAAVHDGNAPILPENPFGDAPIGPGDLDLEDPPRAPAKG